MTENASDDQGTSDDREARKIRWAGRTCIALAVVFVIVLSSFGKPPLTKVSGEHGGRVSLDLVSCLGVCAGLFALFFVIAYYRRLSTPMRVLGMIGVIGLTAHAALALWALFSPGPGRPIVSRTAGYRPLAETGAERWLIDGTAYRVERTYYLRLPQGLQYTVEHPCQFHPSDWPINDQRALEVAFPLMKHAYMNGSYKRAFRPSRIGVTLFERQGTNIRGRRVALSLEDIKKRIENTSPSPSAAPGHP